MNQQQERWKPYKGVLARPIQWWPWFNQDQHSKAIEQVLERLKALYAHYGIDPVGPGADKCLASAMMARHESGYALEWLFERYGVEKDDYVTLVLKLAEKHVPAFKLTNPILSDGGRPKNFSTPQMIIIASEINELTNRGVSVRDACKQLACSERFQDYTQDQIRECWKEITNAWRALMRGRPTANQYRFLSIFWKRRG
jgi:hypothetical protein